jgi:hypothetical protein
MKKTNRKCSHPGWSPYNPMTGEKIPLGNVWECSCGKNTWCDVCGYGMGSWPCDCHKKNIAERRI